MGAGGSVLAYQTGGSRALESRLAWFDRGGKELGEVAAHGVYSEPALSPDGRRVASCVGDPADVWIFDMGRAVGTRFTFSPVANEWSPDGSALAHAVETVARDPGLPSWQIAVRPIAGGAETRAPTSGTPRWSPTGRRTAAGCW